MDRKALSKRLEGLSSIFASETPIATDLKAMAYTLDKMADDKFASILASDFSADEVVASEDKDNSECSKGCNCDTEKSASDAGLFWSKEASDIVLAGLVDEAKGAQLTKEQTPDGHKKAEKPATLKEEQTPNISESLDSDIVKKSQGPVEKSASEEKEAMTDEETADFAAKMQKAKADKAAKNDEAEEEAPAEEEKAAGDEEAEEKAEEKEAAKDEEADEEKEAAQQDAVQPKKSEPGDIDENAGKTDKELGSMEELAKNESKEAFVSEGVELNAPMIDVSLDSKEAQDLEQLFA